jgi:hypothetical protein
MSRTTILRRNSSRDKLLKKPSCTPTSKSAASTLWFFLFPKWENQDSGFA